MISLSHAHPHADNAQDLPKQKVDILFHVLPRRLELQ